MFSLSDVEMDRLVDAAALLPVGSRDAFLRSVAGRVADIPRVGLAELECAIAFVLASYGVSTGNRVFNRTTKLERRAFYDHQTKQTTIQR
jgi:hypothetical protein